MRPGDAVFDMTQGTRPVASAPSHSWFDRVVDAGSSVVHGVANGVTGARDWAAHGIQSAEHGVTNLSHRIEDSVDTGAHSLASRLGGMPIVGSLAHGLADGASAATQVVGGAVQGATSLVGGLANAALHPLDTAHGIEQMAEHAGIPIVSSALRGVGDVNDVVHGRRSAGSAWDRATNPFNQSVQQEDRQFWSGFGHQIIDPYRQSIAQGRYGAALGRGVFDIGSMFIGGGEARAATRGAEAAGTVARVGEAADAAHLAEGASHAAPAADAAHAAPAVRDMGAMQMPAIDPAAIHQPPPAGWHASPLERSPEGYAGGATTHIPSGPPRAPIALQPPAPGPLAMHPITRDILAADHIGRMNRLGEAPTMAVPGAAAAADAGLAHAPTAAAAATAPTVAANPAIAADLGTAATLGR